MFDDALKGLPVSDLAGSRLKLGPKRVRLQRNLDDEFRAGFMFLDCEVGSCLRYESFHDSYAQAPPTLVIKCIGYTDTLVTHGQRYRIRSSGAEKLNEDPAFAAWGISVLGRVGYQLSCQ
jgi:hypothetical protein